MIKIMNRNEARSLAENVTGDDLEKMLEKAAENITDWHRVSRVNIWITIGYSYNLFKKGFDPNVPIHILAKTNMILEFGEYLKTYEKPMRTKRNAPTPIHQDPFG